MKPPETVDQFLSDEDLGLASLSWEELLAQWNAWLHAASATDDDGGEYEHGVFMRLREELRDYDASGEHPTSNTQHPMAPHRGTPPPRAVVATRRFRSKIEFWNEAELFASPPPFEFAVMLLNKPIKPVARDLDRRWMADDYFDLIVWYEAGERLHGFQLCYDKGGRERALTWTRQAGFCHAAIDSGESKPTTNRSPILIQDNDFAGPEVRREFIARSACLPREIRDLVLARIEEYRARREAEASNRS